MIPSTTVVGSSSIEVRGIVVPVVRTDPAGGVGTCGTDTGVITKIRTQNDGWIQRIHQDMHIDRYQSTTKHNELAVYEECCARNRFQGQGQIITVFMPLPLISASGNSSYILRCALQEDISALELSSKYETWHTVYIWIRPNAFDCIEMLANHVKDEWYL